LWAYTTSSSQIHIHVTDARLGTIIGACTTSSYQVHVHLTDASLGTSIVTMYHIVFSNIRTCHQCESGHKHCEHLLHHLLTYLYMSPMRVWVQACEHELYRLLRYMHMSPSEHVLHHVLEYVYISPMRVWVQALGSCTMSSSLHTSTCPLCESG
jgi:hypothetical protein